MLSKSERGNSMKKIIKKLSIIMGIMVLVIVSVNSNVYKASAKGTITSLPKYWYICDDSQKGCTVKVTKSKLTMKNMRITKERAIKTYKKGKFSLKLTKNIKYISGNTGKKLSKKKAVKLLNKKSSAIYSFHVNKQHRVDQICVADW